MTSEEQDDIQKLPLFRPGHRAADFLGASAWETLDEGVGYLRIGVVLPEHVRNPAGQLFGGFTGTYADLVALATAYVGSDEPRQWLATASMHIDFLTPVLGPGFVLEGRLVAAVGRTRVVNVRFLVGRDEEPAVLATVTMRQLASPPVVDGPSR